jgi:hypothetical protein
MKSFKYASFNTDIQLCTFEHSVASNYTHWQSFANSVEISLVPSCKILTVFVAAAAIIAT